MKKILFFVAIFVCLIIINNLIRSIASIWQKEELSLNAQKELNYQKERNRRLKSELSYVQTEEFIEKQARDKLFMTKPNEAIVIVPKADENKILPKKIEEKPNWRKWWELFF